ncbi:MAG: hypothetical protein O2890_06605 [Cyanobacteria bacterium]|nr:hypothetical protein [Cyanobacteriota bacterium]
MIPSFYPGRHQKICCQVKILKTALGVIKNLWLLYINAHAAQALCCAIFALNGSTGDVETAIKKCQSPMENNLENAEKFHHWVYQPIRNGLAKQVVKECL